MATRPTHQTRPVSEFLRYGRGFLSWRGFVLNAERPVYQQGQANQGRDKSQIILIATDELTKDPSERRASWKTYQNPRTALFVACAIPNKHD